MIAISVPETASAKNRRVSGNGDPCGEVRKFGSEKRAAVRLRVTARRLGLRKQASYTTLS